jgi:hypothetical protein
MKKLQLDPLELDKETIARLDEKQLAEIVGGISTQPVEPSSCPDGGSCAPGTTCSGGTSC